MWEITERLKEESWKGRKIKQIILQQMLLLKEYVKEENAIPDSPIGLVLRVQIQDQMP